MYSKLVVSERRDGQVTITGPYVDDPKRFRVVKAPEAGFDLWTRGMLIQNALPALSDDDREFLISGMSPEGHAAMFADTDPTKELREELLTDVQYVKKQLKLIEMYPQATARDCAQRALDAVERILERLAVPQ